VNYSGGDETGLTAHVEILNMDGSLKWEKSAVVDSREDSVEAPITMEYPADLTAVHFIRLKLTQDDNILSENFYWRGTEEGNFTALRTLPKVRLEEKTVVERQGNRWILRTDLNNTSQQPAIMVHLKVVRAKSGDRILPALYSDNYISLMPGEQRSIRTQVEDSDTRGEQPDIVVEGFNIGR